MQRGFVVLYLIFPLIILAGIGGIYYFSKLPVKPIGNQPKACTEEAKQCPDGSYVGRTGPSCEFKPCPTNPASAQTSNTATPSPKAENIDSWKTYTNKKYGYSIKYPGKWQLLESKSFPDSVDFYPSEADMQLITKVDNQQGSPQEGMDTLQWPSMNISIKTKPFSASPNGNKDPFISDWQAVVVDGIEGHFYKTHQCAPKCGIYLDLPFENDQKTLSISASDDADLSIFKLFFTTFKFLDKAQTTPDPDISSCKTDSDCGVNTCSCIAARKDSLSQNMCLVMCPGEPKCINNKCELVKDNIQETFCGGFTGKLCPEGYKCQLDGNYPDAGGKCIKE